MNTTATPNLSTDSPASSVEKTRLKYRGSRGETHDETCSTDADDAERVGPTSAMCRSMAGTRGDGRWTARSHIFRPPVVTRVLSILGCRRRGADAGTGRFPRRDCSAVPRRRRQSARPNTTEGVGWLLGSGPEPVGRHHCSAGLVEVAGDRDRHGAASQNTGPLVAGAQTSGSRLQPLQGKSTNFVVPLGGTTSSHARKNTNSPRVGTRTNPTCQSCGAIRPPSAA